MSDITKIDKNFDIEIPKENDNFVFYDVDNEPFKVYGLMRENGAYYRMPIDIANKVNDGVAYLNSNTAGGRVRFITNSKRIRIKTVMHNVSLMSHFAFTGSAGFDMYINEGENQIYYSTFTPLTDMTEGYESEKEFQSDCEKLVTINFPLYSGVKKLFIGLDKNSKVLPAPDYKLRKPIVYYGSSITQGGCASRPGNAYPAIISRKLDCDYVNLGFSGSAKGEDEMAEYLKNLDMSVFVYDYDHNAHSADYLNQTHKRMFEIIRQANPNLPILMLSRPVPRFKNDDDKRLEIIKKTYNLAKNSGDNNVYFIDGRDLVLDEFAETFSVDGTHPNDSGFLSMATVILEKMKQIL